MLNKCGNFIKHPVDDRDGLCLDNIIFTIVSSDTHQIYDPNIFDV